MRRLLIVGMPRSGTTLLATFLDAQRSVRFITDYVPGFHDACDRLGVGWDTPLPEPQRRVALAIVRDQFLRLRHPVLVGAADFNTMDELHAQVLAELADDHAIVGHKLVLRAHEVRQLLAQTAVHCVLLYRDPRDAALSYWYRTGGGVETYLHDWRQMVTLSGEAPASLSVVRFEDLVSNPERALGPLARELDLKLDFEIGSLAFRRSTKCEVAWRGNSAFGDVAGPFDAAASGRWRDHLSSPVVRYAGWACGEELEALGYPSSPPASLADQLRFRAHALAAATDRVIQRGSSKVSRRLRGWQCSEKR